MGCTSSKLDDLPAVALCRERCSFLDEAIHQRYSLAQSHIAYIHSLQSVGLSLHHFFRLHLDHDHDHSSAGPPSPVLNPPSHRKADPQPSAYPPDNKPTAIHHHHHHSESSSSHLRFHSDSEDEDSPSASLHHLSDAPTPLHPYADPNSIALDGTYPLPASGRFMHVNFMRNQSTPSVTYQQRPMSPDTVRMGDSSSTSSYYPYPYPNTPNPGSFYNYPSFAGGFLGSSQSPPGHYYNYSSPPTVGAGPSSAPSASEQPPPPPPPPTTSAWDFLNPFESFENFYRPYSPSRDSREVREEEGIPDLEEEDFEHEVVKEVHGDQKFVDSAGAGSYSKAPSKDEDDKPNDSESLYRNRPTVSAENDPVEYEVHVVDKQVVDEVGTSGDRTHVRGFKARGGFKGDSDVMREIQVQFERASESGSELAKMLEVGKLPYNRKHATYQASSKMLHTFTSSLSALSSQPSTSKSDMDDKSDPALLDIEGEVSSLRSKNISSTLQKLYLWEKKLYEEVKVEEKMRVLHERKNQRLKRLDEKGAEAHRVDVTRTLVRSLSTKIRISIQIVDKISEKINKLRDEELWPQLNGFIQGLTRMWKSMLECHQNQCQAIVEAKRLDSIALHKHFSEAHLEATLHLEHELLNWILRFSCWVSTQKGYIIALNNWLMKCLLYVPEETPDGIVPFSPGRIGAPPVFVICNHWSQSLERVSEKEVVDSMRDFATNVLQLWERDKLEMRHRVMANKEDMERKVKNLEREDQKIQKEMQALEKRIILVSGEENVLSLNRHAIYQSDTSKNSSLQAGLQRIFEAMERFSANCLKVYEELLQRIEEDNLAREHEKVS